jgi:hypothetical protein
MIRRLVHSLVRFTVALAVGAVVLLAATPARAQFGMDMDSPLMDVSISRRSLDAFTRILTLDKDQKETVVSLFEGYKKDFETAQKKMRDGMKALQEKVADTQDFSIYAKDMPKLGKEFGEKAEVLEKAFLKDVKDILNEQQLANWPRIERFQRRDKLLRIGFASGAAVDLVKIADKVKATAAGKEDLTAVMEKYEIAMDRHLSEMESGRKEMEKKFMPEEGQMPDFKKIQEALKELYTVGKSMRDINQEYTRKLGEVMDEASRARFEAEVKRYSFPRVYRPHHMVKQMDAALKWDDLDSAKKEEVRTLKAAYERDAAPLNDKWAKAIVERDDAGGGTFAVMMATQFGGNQDLNKGVNEARQARRELDNKVKEKFEALLTEEQRAKLPPAPPAKQNDFLADLMPPQDEEEGN